MIKSPQRFYLTFLYDRAPTRNDTTTWLFCFRTPLFDSLFILHKPTDGA